MGRNRGAPWGRSGNVNTANVLDIRIKVGIYKVLIISICTLIDWEGLICDNMLLFVLR